MACSSGGGRWRYDIFLSFRGEDTRRSFVQHLYSAVCVAGFRTCLYGAELQIDENTPLPDSAERSIEQSKLSIVVISWKYITSPWFLDILLKILRCKEKFGQQVIPVFLDIDPLELLALFSKIFARYDERHGANSRVNRWRVALRMIGNLHGWDLHNVQDHWNESNFVQKIVEDASHKLSQTCLPCLIGPEPPMGQFVSLLNMGSICNLAQLEPFGLINNSLNQLQLIDTNKLKSYPESIGICFKLAESQGHDNSSEELHGSTSYHVVLNQLYFNNNILNQGLDYASFGAKQKYREEMDPNVGCRTFRHFSLKDFVKFNTVTSTEGIDAMVEKHQGLIVQKALKLKPVEVEKFPEHLLNLFPDTYAFEKETVVQLWVAGGFFEPEEGDRMEDLANSHFDNLIEKKYISPCGFDRVRRSVKYKVTNIQRNVSQIRYQKVEEAQLGYVSPQIQHLFLIAWKIKPTSFKILHRFERLHTLILFCETGSSLQLPQDLFYSVKQLRSLGLRQSGIFEIPLSVGSLKYLRFLDVSETLIKYLPCTITDLDNLQTLKLDGCSNLIELPREMSKLVKLRHLEFDIFGRLDTMPIEMGNLTSLQTLRAYLVGRKDGCRIVELKNLNNLNGTFCISGLENVLNSHEAKGASMQNKKYIRRLELRWRYCDIGRSKVVEEILDCLQPNACLQELHIFFYCGSVFPDWMKGSYLRNIVDLTLSCCRNCLVLPSLGGFPLLKSLHIIEVTRVEFIDDRFRRTRGSEMHHAFPKLETLQIGDMRGLKEWSGVLNGDFPCLSFLIIASCPKLVALEWLFYLESLKYLAIEDCKEISSLGREKLPSSLEFLSISGCPNLKDIYCSPEASSWFQIAHVPSIRIDHVERSMKDGGDKRLTSMKDGGDKVLTSMNDGRDKGLTSMKDGGDRGLTGS